MAYSENSRNPRSQGRVKGSGKEVAMSPGNPRAVFRDGTENRIGIYKQNSTLFLTVRSSFHSKTLQFGCFSN